MLIYNLYVECTDNTLTHSVSGSSHSFAMIWVLKNPIVQTSLVINGLNVVENHFKNFMQIVKLSQDLKLFVIANLNIISNSKPNKLTL